MPACSECGFPLLEVEADLVETPYSWHYDEGRFESAGTTVATASDQIAEIVRADPEDLRRPVAAALHRPIAHVDAEQDHEGQAHGDAVAVVVEFPSS